MYFKSLDDLNRDIINGLHKIPRNIDLVVGVPRSGLLVANLIALYLNVPLVDLHGFLEGRTFESGSTRRPSNYNEKLKKVLVVEDSVCSGASIIAAKNLIISKKINMEITYFSAYVLEENKNLVDIYLDICYTPRVFEWNIMHHHVVKNACFDLDGVLCVDPYSSQDDDGEMYLRFIKNAEPLFIPTQRIKSIVTCRLEKYRKETQEWLSKWGIEYDNLIMMDYKNKEERIKSGNHAAYKAAYYKKSKAEIFVESSFSQALQISKLASKPVYCIEKRQMIYPNADFSHCGSPTVKMKLLTMLKPVENRCKKAIKVFLKNVFGLGISNKKLYKISK